MECLWCLFGHRQQDGYCDKPYPPVFYLCLHPYDGVPYYSLYDTRFLAEYAEIYLGGEEKPLVLPVGKYSTINVQCSSMEVQLEH